MDQIEDQLRGIRAAIDILAAKGRELQEEKKQLLPKMRGAVR